MLFIGCGGAETPTGPEKPPAVDVAPEETSNAVPADATSPDTTPAIESTDAAEITLTEIDGDGLKAAVEDHKGRVVLIDMWATWCIPCRERFPHVVELSREHEKKGLAVISLSIDEPGKRDDVLTFLTEQQAGFENYIGTYGLGTEATEAFEYGGEVPYYKLYDRQGTLRYQFSGDPRDGIDPIDTMDQRITELLAESA